MARILIIDDDEKLLEMLRRMLEQENYEIMLASDGVEGMEQHRHSPADIIITDLFMPRQEGIETILRIKQESPSVKFIAISGGGNVAGMDYLELAANVGAERTLAKPFTRDQLLEAIKDLLQ
jgi:CheY-like chemotaxis protein